MLHPRGRTKLSSAAKSRRHWPGLGLLRLALAGRQGHFAPAARARVKSKRDLRHFGPKAMEALRAVSPGDYQLGFLLRRSCAGKIVARALRGAPQDDSPNIASMFRQKTAKSRDKWTDHPVTSSGSGVHERRVCVASDQPNPVSFDGAAPRIVPVYAMAICRAIYSVRE
jgi:hypothetical protein